MTKEEKIQVIEEFVGIFSAPGIYLMDFKGLNVAEMTEFRRKLSFANISMRVVKNTLARLALEKAGIESLESYFVGQTSVVWSEEDSVTPARLILDFIKEHKKGEFKAGLVDGTLVTENQVEAISKLPTKQELYWEVASSLNAPMLKIACVLNAVPEKLVRTIKAIMNNE